MIFILQLDKHILYNDKYTLHFKNKQVFFIIFNKSILNYLFMTNTNKPATSFWVIGVIALIWNLMGVAAYLGQAFMTDEMKAALPENQQALYENVPTWATAAFAIAVWGGLLACILLLMKKKLSKTVFIVSLIGILVQMVYNLFISGAMEVYGPGGMIMPLMVVIIGVFLVWYSKKCADDGILS